MATQDENETRKPTPEEIEAFFARHEARRDPTKDFWWMQPLCPPETMDALDVREPITTMLGKMAFLDNCRWARAPLN